jgi:predicted DNA-binding transcriptional regulator AlpA
MNRPPVLGVDDAANMRRVSTRFLMERYNCSDRTIDRWVANAALNFPQPLRINTRRYWSLSDVVRWEAEHEARQAEKAAKPAPTPKKIEQKSVSASALRRKRARE